MTADHYIEWIELMAGATVLRQELAPGDAPEATFCTTADGVTARAYCNLHGNWKS
jgi:superoxide reductase